MQKTSLWDALARCVFGVLICTGAFLLALPRLAAQRQPATSYDLHVSNPERGLLVLRLMNNQGTVVVYLPDGLREGEPFSGTFNSLGTISSTATLDYALELGEQHAKLRDGAFHWKIPEKTGGHVRLRFTGYYGEELAVMELPVAQASDPVEAPLPGGDKLHLPTMIQSGLSFPIFGPLDGDSSTTSVEVAGQKLQVFAELPGKAVVAGPNNLAGMSSYEIKKGVMEGKGETRVINIEQKLPSPPQRNGKTGKLKIRVTGLAGVTADVPIRFAITPRQDALFEPTMKYEYFVSPEQFRFIEPKEVKADGSFSTQRTIMRIIPGSMDVSVQLVIPQNLHDVVDTVLRMQRHNYSKLPEQEYAVELKPYGDAVWPVVAEFLSNGNAEQQYGALTLLLLDADKAAPLVIARMPQMGNGQPLGMALDAYTKMALTKPDFPYRKELREAVLQLIAERDSVGAIYALGKIGSEDDIPLLEQLYSETLGNSNEEGQMRQAINAALARLGVKDNIENLEKELAIPVKAAGDETNFRFATERAIYADRKEFVPYLCRHIHDPAWSFGDYGVYPAGDAIGAIAAIEHGKMTQEQVGAVCQPASAEPPGNH